MAKASKNTEKIVILCTKEEREEFLSLALKANVRPADIAKRGAFKEARELAGVAEKAAA